MVNFNCICCKDSFEEAHGYKRHLTIHHLNNLKFNQNKIKDEFIRLKDPSNTKVLKCNDCGNFFSTKNKQKNHSCIKKDITSKSVDNKFISEKHIHDNTINNIQNNVQNNNIQYTINIYTNLSRIDLSNIIDEKFIMSLHNKIIKPLDANRQNRINTYNLQTINHERLKTDQYKDELNQIRGSILMNNNIIKTNLLEKLSYLFKEIYFSDHSLSNLYIPSEKNSDDFYVCGEEGWDRKDQNFLYEIANKLYESVTNIYHTYRPKAQTMLEKFYKDQYEDLIQILATRLRKIGYDNKHIVEPMFQATRYNNKNIKININHEIEDDDQVFLPDLPSTKDNIDPEPTYVLRSQDDPPRRYNYSKYESNNIVEQGSDAEEVQLEESQENDSQPKNNIQEEEFEFFLTRDNVEVYVDTYKGNKYLIAPKRSNIIYPYDGKKISDISLDNLESMGRKIAKGNFHF
jgi:hypothetical protein